MNCQTTGVWVMPGAKGRDAAAWGTFVNITPDGPSRKAVFSRLEHDTWVAAGYLEEKSSEKAIFSQFLVGAPQALYEREGMRYFYVTDNVHQSAVPTRINGMSGSGVWRLPVGRKIGEETTEIATPILTGITFRQEHGRSSEPLAFYVHDLESIADRVLRWLDTQEH